MPANGTPRARARTPRDEPDHNGSPAAGTHTHDHELTVTIPLDRMTDMVTAPLTAAGRVLSSRGGLPVYVGLGVLAAADVVTWPVAVAVGAGYAVLRRWGPAYQPPRPPGYQRS